MGPPPPNYILTCADKKTRKIKYAFMASGVHKIALEYCIAWAISNCWMSQEKLLLTIRGTFEGLTNYVFKVWSLTFGHYGAYGG